jgi:uncharacterized protein YjiS (DUF1127 family)
MAFLTNIAAPSSAFQSGLNSVVSALKEKLARRRLYRATFIELAGLSDRDLADLGMHRSMIKRLAWQAAHDS